MELFHFFKSLCLILKRQLRKLAKDLLHTLSKVNNYQLLSEKRDNATSLNQLQKLTKHSFGLVAVAQVLNKTLFGVRNIFGDSHHVLQQRSYFCICKYFSRRGFIYLTNNEVFIFLSETLLIQDVEL